MKLYGIALLSAVIVGSAFAGQEDRVDIWSPNAPVKDQHIKLISWGSGNIGQATDVANDGAFSIRISTHNYFQGGIMLFNDPKDVSKNFDDPSNLLQITVRTADAVVLHSGGAQAGGAAGGAKFGGKGGGGGGAGDAPTPETTQQIKPTLNRVRMIITTTDGKKSESYLPLPVTGRSPWHSIAIPLQKVSGLDKTNKIIQQIAFSGDATTTYYIGDIRLIHDATPITGEMNAKEPLNLALGDTVQFKGSGEAGSTVLRYEWCFDSANGFTVDSRGSVVSHKFRKPGKYTVTLMVTDYYGAKKPFSVSDEVTVNP